jgi:hypothetical protein
MSLEVEIRSSDEFKEITSVFKEIGNYPSYAKLVGGAIPDILDGRMVKDYDIIDGLSMKKSLTDIGFVIMSDTSTAITLVRSSITIQLLKTKLEDFDFTVGQSSYSFSFDSFRLPEYELKNKILLPVAYQGNKQILKTLSRIPHWMKKGYRIKEESYFSLLNNLEISEKKELYSFPYSS